MGMWELLGIIIAAVIIIILYRAVVTVPQGYDYTLERFGKYKRTMQPGLHFIDAALRVRRPQAST